MAQDIADHRRKIEEKQLDSDIADRIAARSETRIGQFCGLAIGMTAIIGGVIAAILGAPISGGFIGTGGVVALVAVFVLGRRAQPPSEVPSVIDGEPD